MNESCLLICYAFTTPPVLRCNVQFYLTSHGSPVIFRKGRAKGKRKDSQRPLVNCQMKHRGARIVGQAVVGSRGTLDALVCTQLSKHLAATKASIILNFEVQVKQRKQINSAFIVAARRFQFLSLVRFFTHVIKCNFTFKF